MTDRRLAYITATGLTLWQAKKGCLPFVEAVFSANDEGHAAFSAYLAQHPRCLLHVLVDIMEEGFEHESLPFVRGQDRRDMLTRKLSQYFFNTPLRLTMSHGRSASGRRDEHMLFAGLTGHPLLEEWLQALQQAEAMVAGIYSTAFVLADLARILQPTLKPLLLVTMTRAGIRQTFCDQGRLCFSRLTALTAPDPQDIATACAAEVHQLHQYLLGHQFIPQDTVVDTLIIARQADLATFADHCVDTDERPITLLATETIGERIRLPQRKEENDIEPLLMALLLKSPPKHQFAPATMRHAYRLWQTRRGLLAASLLTLATAAVILGSQMMRYMELSTHKQLLQAELDIGQQRYARIIGELPAIALSHDELRALTTRYQFLERISPGPKTLLIHISRAVTQSPDVELTHLQWWLGSHPDPSSPGQTPLATRAGSALPDGQAYALAIVQARLPSGMSSNRRLQLDTVNAFTRALHRDNVAATVVTLPEDINSAQTLPSRNTSDAADPPQFAVRLVQKL